MEQKKYPIKPNLIVPGNDELSKHPIRIYNDEIHHIKSGVEEIWT